MASRGGAPGGRGRGGGGGGRGGSKRGGATGGGSGVSAAAATGAQSGAAGAGGAGAAMTTITSAFAGLKTSEMTREELAEHNRIIEMKSMILTDYAPRPSFGTSGRPIAVQANMFQTKLKGQGKTIFHYDVEIDPVVKVTNQKKPEALLRKCWAALGEVLTDKADKDAYKYSAYDGRKNTFTPFEFSDEKKSFIITLLDDDAAPAGKPKPAAAKKPKALAPPPKDDSAQGSDAEDDKDKDLPGRRFRVTIQFAAKIDLDSLRKFCEGKREIVHNVEAVLTSIMAINVLLRDDPNKRFVQSGRKGARFFPPANENGASSPLPDGGVVGKGFFQSFRPALGLPAIQLDTAFSAFLAHGPLMEVAARVIGSGRGGGGDRGGRGGFRGGDRGGRGGGRGGAPGPMPAGQLPQALGQGDVAKLNKVLKMAKITLTHRNTSRVYTMDRLTMQGADQIEFDYDADHNGRTTKISLVAYYQRVYGITIRFPRLPAVQYSKKNFIPMELVKVVPYNPLPPHKLTANQTADMIKVSARPPQERREAIMAWRQRLGYQNLEKMSAWGLDISPNMTDVQARVLDAPGVQYSGRDGLMRVNQGSWNLRGKRFFSPAMKPLKAWSLVSFDRYTDSASMTPFIAELVKTLRGLGCDVANQAPPCLGPFNPAQLQEHMRTAARAAWEAGKMDPQMIIVIMPGRETALYESIKQFGALGMKMPVVTQCLQANKIKQERGRDQYCANVGMKIHSKLGGVTHTVPYGNLPGVTAKTMFIGADVTHPPGGQYAANVPPSIAVTVATTKGVNGLYSVAIRLQEGRTEPIADIAAMVQQHLKEFQTNMKELPTNIVFYRDGVSEGQYAAIIDLEVAGCRRACEAVKSGYNPKLTYVICAKKHNMRFFAKNAQDADRTGNLPAGTVVDNVVTHPFAYDFFLQAHAGLVGTARPTHYIVLVDENKFRPDDLQKLTNALCYNFPRATRSVSIVSIAYIADVICTQARAILTSEIYDGSTEYSGGDRPAAPQAYDQLKLTTALAKNPDWAKVAWYM